MAVSLVAPNSLSAIFARNLVIGTRRSNLSPCTGGGSDDSVCAGAGAALGELVAFFTRFLRVLDFAVLDFLARANDLGLGQGIHFCPNKPWLASLGMLGFAVNFF